MLISSINSVSFCRHHHKSKEYYGDEEMKKTDKSKSEKKESLKEDTRSYEEQWHPDTTRYDAWAAAFGLPSG